MASQLDNMNYSYIKHSIPFTQHKTTNWTFAAYILNPNRIFDDERRWKVAVVQYLIPRIPEVYQISINIDQWYYAGVFGCRTPAESEARRFPETISCPLF